MATRAEWKARALEAEAWAEGLDVELASMKVERDNLKLTLADCDAGRWGVEQSLASANDHIASLDRTIIALEGEVDAAERERDAWKAKYEALVTPPPPTKTPRWFADSSPWNQNVRGEPIHPNSQAIVNQILDGLPGVNDSQGQPSRPTANVIAFSAGACWDQWDYEHPVFWAKDTDPLRTITGNADCLGTKIRVPANAWSSQHPSASGGGDAAAAIVQPDGQGYEFWRADFSNPSEVRTQWGEKGCNYRTGNGLPGITLGDFSMGAGVLRPHEIIEGLIPHALFLVTYNYSGWQVPAGSGKQPFRFLNHPNVPKMGTRLRLDLTDTEIAALPSYLRPLAFACRDYGLIVGDTGGGGLHADNSDKAAWDAACKASGAPAYNGTWTFDLRKHVDMRSKLKVLA